MVVGLLGSLVVLSGGSTALAANGSGPSSPTTEAAAASGPAIPSEGGECRAPATVASPTLAPHVPGDVLGSSYDKLLQELARFAINKGASSAVGWASTLIFGPSDTDEIKAQLAQVSQQLTVVNQNLDQLSKQLKAIEAAIVDDAHRNTYNVLVGELKTAQLSKISGLDRRFNTFVLGRPPKSPLDGDAVATLNAIRQQMPAVIESIRLHMSGSGGLLAYFDDLAWRHQPFYRQGLTVDRAVYTDSYLTPAYTQMDEYKGWLVRALYLLSEAYHITYEDASGAHPAKPQFVECEVQVVEQTLAAWRLQAASGVEPVPGNTVVDARTGLMWSRSSVTLPNQPKIGGLPLYCWTNDKAWLPAQENLFLSGCTDKGPDFFSGLLPSPPLPLPTAPLPTLVYDLDYAGLSGWRIPNQADWQSLLPAKSQDPVGWLEAQGFSSIPQSTGKRVSAVAEKRVLTDVGAGGGVTALGAQGAQLFQNRCVEKLPIKQLCRQVPGLLYVTAQYFVGS